MFNIDEQGLITFAQEDTKEKMKRFGSNEEKRMALLERLLAATSEVAIAQEVAIYHDIVRVSYPFLPNKLGSFEDFTNTIADYYSYHFSRCWEDGRGPSHSEASRQAIQILEQEYRSCGGDIFTAYKDACDGTNGGLMVIFDIIAENLKAESVELYIQNVFEKYMSSVSQEGKVEIICCFIARHGHNLPSSIFTDQPKRYTDNYRELIKAYVEVLKRRSPIFRILPTSEGAG